MKSRPVRYRLVSFDADGGQAVRWIDLDPDELEDYVRGRFRHERHHYLAKAYNDATGVLVREFHRRDLIDAA